MNILVYIAIGRVAFPNKRLSTIFRIYPRLIRRLTQYNALKLTLWFSIESYCVTNSNLILKGIALTVVHRNEMHRK